MTEVKEVTNGKLVNRKDIEEITNLKERLSTKDQLVGEQKATIDYLKKQVEELKKSEKIKVIKKGGAFDPYLDRPKDHVEYLGLSTIEKEIEDKVSKQLKIDRSALENSVYDKEAKIEDLKRENDRKNIQFQRDLKRIRIDTEKDFENKIAKLKEENNKLRKERTDKDLENKRKKEIKALQERIADLEIQLEQYGKMPWYIRIFFNKAKRLALKEQVAKELRTAQAMGNYEDAWRIQSSASTSTTGYTDYTDSSPYMPF